MELGHTLHHLRRDFMLWRTNIRMSRRIRDQKIVEEGDYIFRSASHEDLKAIEELHNIIYRVPFVNWIRWVYKYRYAQLIGVVTTKDGTLVGYDSFIINEVEVEDRIIHELDVVIAPKFQGQGLSTRLRRYSISCYDHGFFNGVSTLARENDIKALRSAQKSGYAITKMSAKPPAYYLYQNLTRKFSNTPCEA